MVQNFPAKKVLASSEVSSPLTHFAFTHGSSSVNFKWRSSTAFKTGRREVQGSNPSRACRPSRSEFSLFFSETRVSKG